MASVVSAPLLPNYGFDYHNDSYFYDVTAVTKNDMWAVGHGYSTGQTLIEHWDGSTWSIVPSPKVGQFTSPLHGVAAVASDDVWTVGYTTTSISSTKLLADPLILHWDGKGWNRVQAPIIGAEWSQLSAVTAISTQDIWAVGNYLDGDRVARALTMHWDGHTWTHVPAPNGMLNAVVALSRNDVWAVGSIDKQTLAIYWDGKTWARISSPNPANEPLFVHGSEALLNGVTALAKDDVWAVGTQIGAFPVNADYDQHASRTLALHWDGSQWSIVPSPGYDTTYNFVGVDRTPNGDVLAVGHSGSGWNHVQLARFHRTACTHP